MLNTIELETSLNVDTSSVSNVVNQYTQPAAIIPPPLPEKTYLKAAQPVKRNNSAKEPSPQPPPLPEKTYLKSYSMSAINMKPEINNNKLTKSVLKTEDKDWFESQETVVDKMPEHSVPVKVVLSAINEPEVEEAASQPSINRSTSGDKFYHVNFDFEQLNPCELGKVLEI